MSKQNIIGRYTLFLGKPEGVREGSIFAAIAVGNIIKFYNYIYSKINQKF